MIIKGLTTAASIWFTAAIEIASAVGRLWLPIVAAFFGVLVLSALGSLERAIESPDRRTNCDNRWRAGCALGQLDGPRGADAAYRDSFDIPLNLFPSGFVEVAAKLQKRLLRRNVVKRLLLALVLLSAALAVPLYAHHSFAAYYYENESMTVEGSIVQFDFKNPHAWVHIAVKDANGQTLTYSAEWSNPNNLTRQNITKETLKAGDHVIITGSPGRNASEHKLHLKAIERPSDGWRWRGGRR